MHSLSAAFQLKERQKCKASEVCQEDHFISSKTGSDERKTGKLSTKSETAAATP